MADYGVLGYVVRIMAVSRNKQLPAPWELLNMSPSWAVPDVKRERNDHLAGKCSVSLLLTPIGRVTHAMTYRISNDIDSASSSALLSMMSAIRLWSKRSLDYLAR
jgi:hypothetical protein